MAVCPHSCRGVSRGDVALRLRSEGNNPAHARSNDRPAQQPAQKIVLQRNTPKHFEHCNLLHIGVILIGLKRPETPRNTLPGPTAGANKIKMMRGVRRGAFSVWDGRYGAGMLRDRARDQGRAWRGGMT